MTAKVNVLMAIDHVGYNGHLHGAGRVFSNILSRVDRSRFRIIPWILRREDRFTGHLPTQQINVFWQGRRKLDPRTLLDFVRAIKANDIHVLHLHQYGSSIFGRLAGLLTGVPTIVHCHGVDHSGAWYHQIGDAILAKFTNRAIGVSTASLVRRRLNSPKALLLANAISLEEFKPLSAEECQTVRKQLGVEPDAHIVGCITRLREEKGNEFLLKAAPRVLEACPRTYFVIVGSGPLLECLRTLAAQIGVENRVIFTGFRQDVVPLLSIFDVKVIPSLSEGMPVALLEAMAMGKAIVATAVGGIQEFLGNDEPVLLVPPRDPTAIADNVIALLLHEKERIRLGALARAQSKKYSLDAYIHALEQLYEDLACKRRQPET